MMLRKLLSVIAVISSVLEVSAQIDSLEVFQLDEATVSAAVATAGLSPLRITDISREDIIVNSPGRTFPEIIRNVPGVYSTSETGSYGDARINIRGFKQENISVLLNGIPISGLTSGSMYWNNWAGLSDVTASIQLQKGIGNSMLSDNSVGGTINILTMTPSMDGGGNISYSYTGYGMSKANLEISSGQLKNGWSFAVNGSYTWGNSYVECSAVNSWSYLAVISKKFNSRHSLNFTALGSPEQHEQRSSRLSYGEVEKYGIEYNKNWGVYTDSDGNKSARTLSKNTYFKPYFTLTHTYKGETGSGIAVRLNTSLYGAIADGGGYYTESTGKRIASFLVPDGNQGAGHLDWDAVYDYNLTSPGVEGFRAQNIMTDYQAGHTQMGVKSDLHLKFSERWKLEAGLHWQMHNTWEREQITDLLGADYWYEDYAANSLAGQAGRSSIKHVGDYIRTYNGRNQHYFTLYALGAYVAGARKNVILTLGTSGSGTVLQRWDKYNYVGDGVDSEWTGKMGGSVKGGVLYKPVRGLGLYLNGAAYSRAPYSSVFFSSGNNSVSQHIVNEKNYLAEAGTRFSGDVWGVEATFYTAYWKDKTLMSSPYKTLEEEPVKYMVNGLDALHYGGELEAFVGWRRFFRADFFASLGDWRWKNDVEATIYDPVSMQPVNQVKVYADGLHVGDAPQTQVGASVEFHPFELGTAAWMMLADLSLRFDWNYNDRLWADFDPVNRTNPDDRSDPYLIPSYHLMNMNITWTQQIVKVKLSVFFNLNNIGNISYIERSKDGSLHDRSTFTGYWGNGRNINFGVRLGI